MSMMARSPSSSVRQQPYDEGGGPPLTESTPVAFTGKALLVGIWTLVASTVGATLYISSTFYSWANAQDRRLTQVESWIVSHSKEADDRWAALLRQQERDREEAKEMRNHIIELLREIKGRS